MFLSRLLTCRFSLLLLRFLIDSSFTQFQIIIFLIAACLLFAMKKKDVFCSLRLVCTWRNACYDSWWLVGREKRKFNQAINTSNQIVERNKNQWWYSVQSRRRPTPFILIAIIRYVNVFFFHIWSHWTDDQEKKDTNGVPITFRDFFFFIIIFIHLTSRSIFFFEIITDWKWTLCEEDV